MEVPIFPMMLLPCFLSPLLTLDCSFPLAQYEQSVSGSCSCPGSDGGARQRPPFHVAARHPQGLLLFLRPGGALRERPAEWLQPRKVKEARLPWGGGILGLEGAKKEGLLAPWGLQRHHSLHLGQRAPPTRTGQPGGRLLWGKRDKEWQDGKP